MKKGKTKLHKWRDMKRAVKSIDDLPTKPNAALKRAAALYSKLPRTSDAIGEELLSVLGQFSRDYAALLQRVPTLHDVIVIAVIARVAVESKGTTVAEDVEFAFEYADAVVAEKAKRSTANGFKFTLGDAGHFTNAAAAAGLGAKP